MFLKMRDTDINISPSDIFRVKPATKKQHTSHKSNKLTALPYRVTTNSNTSGTGNAQRRFRLFQCECGNYRWVRDAPSQIRLTMTCIACSHKARQGWKDVEIYHSDLIFDQWINHTITVWKEHPEHGIRNITFDEFKKSEGIEETSVGSSEPGRIRKEASEINVINMNNLGYLCRFSNKRGFPFSYKLFQCKCGNYRWIMNAPSTMNKIQGCTKCQSPRWPSRGVITDEIMNQWKAGALQVWHESDPNTFISFKSFKSPNTEKIRNKDTPDVNTLPMTSDLTEDDFLKNLQNQVNSLEAHVSKIKENQDNTCLDLITRVRKLEKISESRLLPATIPGNLKEQIEKYCSEYIQKEFEEIPLDTTDVNALHKRLDKMEKDLEKKRIDLPPRNPLFKEFEQTKGCYGPTDSVIKNKIKDFANIHFNGNTNTAMEAIAWNFFGKPKLSFEE